MLTYSTIPEFRLTQSLQTKIAALRNASFPDHQVARSYYKQLPHSRILALDDDALLGHVGVDYRVIRLGEIAVRTLGVIDLCVADGHRGQGTASGLLRKLCKLGADGAADFVVLCADDERLYRRHGFTRVLNTCRWLRLHEHESFGVAEESLADCLMVKSLGPVPWAEEDVDFLGYLF